MKAGGRHRLSSSPFVPEEILEQIIARVPCIKSLMRCTSVCKSWYAVINSTSFIKLHLCLLQGIDVNHKYLLCEFDETYFFPYCDGAIGAFHECFAHHMDEQEFKTPYFAIQTDTEAFHENCRLFFPLNLRYLHACNGLICYNTYDDPDSLYLWNPVIRKLKHLPNPPPNLNNNNTRYSVFKLWFDSKTNDHKILRITYTTKSCTVEVYSLATNSWKIITDDAPVTTSFLNDNRLAYANRTFYWPALRDGNWILISLQVDNWMFHERLTSWTVSRLYLTPSGDSDTLVILGNGYRDDIVDALFAWGRPVFQVYDDACGIYRQYRPLGIRNNGELLLQDIHKELKITSYSVRTKQYKEFVPTTSHKLIRTIPFVQTLALLNDADSYSTQ